MLRASNQPSRIVNKSTVLSLPLDISQNWLLQRTLTDRQADRFPQVFLLMFNEQHIYIGGVVVSGLTLSAVDSVFEHWLGENKDHKIDIC